MTDQEKLALLEETFEMDEGTLTPDLELDSIEEFNSLTKLSLIVLMDDEFGKSLSGDQIKAFKTVQDIMDFMG